MSRKVQQVLQPVLSMWLMEAAQVLGKRYLFHRQTLHYTALGGALGTADAVITFEIAGTLITSGAITITQSGSAAGDLDSSTPSGNNTVTAGQVLEVITNGGSSNTVDVNITFVLDVE